MAKVQPLHMAKSLEELNKKITHDKIKQAAPKLYVFLSSSPSYLPSPFLFFKQNTQGLSRQFNTSLYISIALSYLSPSCIAAVLLNFY